MIMFLADSMLSLEPRKMILVSYALVSGFTSTLHLLALLMAFTCSSKSSRIFETQLIADSLFERF